MYLLYSLALGAYLIAQLPVLAYRAMVGRKEIGRVSDRFGRLPATLNPDHQRSIWIHAVSVGEVLAARALLGDLRRAYPAHRLLLSTTTATGQRVARGLGDAIDGVFFAPLDLSPFVTRTLDRVAPELLVVVDTEIWPTLLHACRRRGVRTVVVNGRISDRSYRRYRLARWFMRPVLRDLDRVCAQTEPWGRRFVDLGLPSERLTVTGSLKFDAVGISAAGAELHVGDRALPYFRFASDRPVLIAASTLEGEEEPVLRAFARVRETVPDALLVIAPRHPDRFDAVHRIACADGFEVARRTELSLETEPSASVIVLDTIGELARVFQCATVVFVGGSLVPAGGHNILEPAVFGKPVVFGPHMENFAEIAELFVRREAAVQVGSSAGLERALAQLMADPVRRASLGAAARALVDAHRGARHRSLAVIAELLPVGSSPHHARSLRALS